MSDRYCFYCGNKLGFKEVCSCRQRQKQVLEQAAKQAQANHQTSAKQPDSATNFTADNATDRANHQAKQTKQTGRNFFTNCRSKISSAFKKFKHSSLTFLKQCGSSMLHGFYRLSQFISHKVGAGFHDLIFDPVNLILKSRQLVNHQIVGFILMHASLLALAISLFIGNSSFGHLLRSYMSMFNVSSTSLWFKEVELILQLVCFTICLYLLKIFLFSFFFSNRATKLNFQSAGQLVVVASYYRSLATAISLCFSFASPLQFVLWLCLGGAVAFYMELQSCVKLLGYSEARCFTRLLACDVILLAFASIIGSVVLPQITSFSIL